MEQEALTAAGIDVELAEDAVTSLWHHTAVRAHLVAGRRTGAAATGAEATTRSAARGDCGSAAPRGRGRARSGGRWGGDGP